MRKILRVLVMMLTLAVTVQGTASAQPTDTYKTSGSTDGGGRPPGG